MSQVVHGRPASLDDSNELHINIFSLLSNVTQQEGTATCINLATKAEMLEKKVKFSAVQPH
jgi:hypothetical protein